MISKSQHQQENLPSASARLCKIFLWHLEHPLSSKKLLKKDVGKFLRFVNSSEVLETSRPSARCSHSEASHDLSSQGTSHIAHKLCACVSMCVCVCVCMYVLVITRRLLSFLFPSAWSHLCTSFYVASCLRESYSSDCWNSASSLKVNVYASWCLNSSQSSMKLPGLRMMALPRNYISHCLI